MKTQTAFRLEADILQSLKDLAKDGRPMSWHVDKALRAYLGESKTKPKKAPAKRFDPIAYGADHSGLHQEAWAAWCQKRASMKKPISEQAAKSQISLLTKHDANTQRRMVWNSIQNDYQGLFELKEDKARESLIQRTERKAKEGIAAIEATENALDAHGNALWLQVDKR